MKRILVVGAGATGGLFGGRLVQAGRDVTFLVRPGRAEVLRERGLRIVGQGEQTELHPKLLVAGEITEPFDVVLVTVKAMGLEQAIADLAPAVGPDTLVLPFLNGMRHLDVLDKRFGADQVVGCYVRVSTTVDGAGDIQRLGEFEDMVYGARTGTSPRGLSELHETMSGAGFNAVLSEHIEQDMWGKWVFLASLGAVTGLMRGTVGDVEAVPGGAAFASAVVDECAAVAAASGYPLPADAVASTRAVVTTPGSPFASSLQRDLVAGNSVEGEQIFGDLTARARELGVATPLLDLMTIHVRVHQNRLAHQTFG